MNEPIDHAAVQADLMSVPDGAQVEAFYIDDGDEFGVVKGVPHLTVGQLRDLVSRDFLVGDR